jgi:quercetin dioxygenase-like cupin family protein
VVEPLVSRPGEGKANGAFGLKRSFRLLPGDNASAIGLFEEWVPQGSGPPMHIHHDADELFTVLEGQVLFHCDGNEVTLGQGSTLLVPRGARHAFKGLSAGESRLLIQLTPGHSVGMFLEAEAEDLSAQGDPERFRVLAEKYQMEFVGPPL